MSRTSTIRVLHTLGPAGTNCEQAARHWLGGPERGGKVVLYETLERAVDAMPYDVGHALLGCVVYPELHTLVFSNLRRLELVECFVYPTYNMVLASRTGQMPRSVVSHPAPVELIPTSVGARLLANSNAQAAIDCAAGRAEGCITTIVAAREKGLVVVEDYGPVPMGFSIHAPKFEARP
ncbi:MAG: hypothetical protein MUF34_26910 [Polyangiaceae bacterium]|jgi:hypothetical protein|nr:hypothetical protein [Polyangiaceae bacterium]